MFMLNVRHFKCFAELHNIFPPAAEMLPDSFRWIDACSKKPYSEAKPFRTLNEMNVAIYSFKALI